MGKICLLLIEDLYIIFIFLVAGIIFLCLNFKFYEIKKLTLAKNGVLLSKWKLNNTRWEDHQNTKEKCTLLMYFVHYVVYAVCKKEPGPTWFQISKVRRRHSPSQYVEGISRDNPTVKHKHKGWIFHCHAEDFFLPIKIIYFNYCYCCCCFTKL